MKRIKGSWLSLIGLLVGMSCLAFVSISSAVVPNVSCVGECEYEGMYGGCSTDGHGCVCTVDGNPHQGSYGCTIE